MLFLFTYSFMYKSKFVRHVGLARIAIFRNLLLKKYLLLLKVQSQAII